MVVEYAKIKKNREKVCCFLLGQSCLNFPQRVWLYSRCCAGLYICAGGCINRPLKMSAPDG